MDGELESLWLWVLEDETDLREVITYLGESEGMAVSQMGNLKEAWSVLNEFVRLSQAPHVIVSDFKLPDGDCLEFLVQCRGHFIKTPIFCISGEVDGKSGSLLAEYEITTVEKPLSVSDILKMILAWNRS